MAVFSSQPRSRCRATPNVERQREFHRRYPHYNRLVKAWKRRDLQGLLPEWQSSRREDAAVRALFRSEHAVKVAEVLQARLLLPPAERKSLPVPADLLALVAPAEPAALPAPAVTALTAKPQLALPAPAEPVDTWNNQTADEAGTQLARIMQ